jgi:hypothetical protein
MAYTISHLVDMASYFFQLQKLAGVSETSASYSLACQGNWAKEGEEGKGL